MRCATCPKSSGRCLGERLAHLCQRADYRGFLAAHEPYFAAEPGDGRDDREPGDAFGPDPGPPGDPRARVGLLCPCLNMGGAEAWQLALARLADPGRVRFVGCVVADPRGPGDPAMAAATRALMPVGSGYSDARRLAARCDVLVGWAVPGLPAILEGLPRRPAVVEVCHAPAESPWGRDVYGRTSGVDRWVAVSELALEAIPLEARASTPTSVIRNCVDPARLEVRRTRGEMRRLWGVPEGSPVLGYLGRLAEEKHPQAVRMALDHLPGGWHAVLVGAGCEEIGEHPRLHLAGPDPAAGDCLNAFDVLMVPSKYESFGLTLAEGLWMGVPVVSTPVGIARLRPGLTQLVPHGADGRTLAAAVLRAHADGPRRGSREWARADLAPGRFGREWTDLIASMVPRAPGPPGLLEKAGSFVRAAAAHLADGGRSAPPGVVAAREAACAACPHLDAARNACALCGCNLALKRRWASSECPIGRWGPA